MAMPGAISLMIMHVHAPTDGVKTELLEYQTIINVSVLAYLSGTAKTTF